MVPRYSRPAMTAIWSPETRFCIWFEIEAHATEKLGDLGVVAANHPALFQVTNPLTDCRT